MWYRPARVAGYFYPEDPSDLRETIEECFLSPLGPKELPKNIDSPILKMRGLISPHAGYIYSGPVASWGYLRLSYAKRPKTIIIIGPNHRGLGPHFAIFPEGRWETPLGKVKVDEFTSQQLMEKVDFLKPSEIAHRDEHSIEVQLPFLQYLWENDFSIVPIAISYFSIEELLLLGKAIAELKNIKDILFIASSDFSHYVSSLFAEKVDKKAISFILKKDPEGFFKEVLENRLSICGAGPITIMLYYLKNEKVDAKLLKYGNSGDVTGDYSEVVAYASISFEKVEKR